MVWTHSPGGAIGGGCVAAARRVDDAAVGKVAQRAEPTVGIGGACRGEKETGEGVGDWVRFAGDAGERNVAAKGRRDGESAQGIGKARRIELRKVGEDDAAVDLAGKQPRRRLRSNQPAQGRHIRPLQVLSSSP